MSDDVPWFPDLRIDGIAGIMPVHIPEHKDELNLGGKSAVDSPTDTLHTAEPADTGNDDSDDSDDSNDTWHEAEGLIDVCSI